MKASVRFDVGELIDLRGSLRELVNNQYSRNDIEISRGRFRIKGDVLEIGPAYEDRLVRIELFGEEVEAIRYVDPITGEILQSLESINITRTRRTKITNYSFYKFSWRRHFFWFRNF